MIRLKTIPVRGAGKYPLEIDEQKACWAWLGQSLLGPNSGATWQDYSYMVPNGTQLSGGRAHRAMYMNSLKAQGFRTGVSDLVIAVPSGGYHGAYIELKRDVRAYRGPAAIKAAVRLEQKVWLAKMEEQGYWTAIAYGAEDFKSLMRSYMRGESPRRLDTIPEMSDTDPTATL